MKNHPSDVADLPLRGGGSRALSLEKLVDTLPEVVCVLDRDGCFRFVSAASERLWGYTPGELEGRSIFDLLLPEDVAKTRQALATHAPDACCRCENRFGKPDGSGVSLLWSGRWDDSEGLFYGVVRESCDPRQVEMRLNSAQRLARIASYEYDLVHHRYTHISDTLFDIFGLDRAEHPEFTLELFRSLVHPDDKSLVEFALHAESLLPQSTLECRIVRPDGKVVYINRLCEAVCDSTGRPLKSLGTVQDITALKQAELTAAQMGQRFKTVVENSSGLIAIIDGEGTYQYVAENVEHLLGHAVRDLVGKSALEFIHPDDQPMLGGLLTAVPSRQCITVDPFRFRNRAGEWRWIEAVVTNFLDDPLIGGLVVNSRDVTVKKRHEDQIRRLSLIAEEVHSAILLMDEHHRITWSNKAFTALSGYTLEEMEGRLPQEVFVTETTGVADHHQIQMALRAGLTVHREMPCCSKTGRRYWIDLHIQPVHGEAGQPVQYMAIGKDVTERKEAQEALALREQKFKALVRHSSDLTVVIDENGMFLYGSDNVRELLGHELAMLRGRNSFDFIHPEDVDRVMAEIDMVKGARAGATGVIHRLLTGSGEWIWLESKATNHLSNPAIGGILVNARDITERIELQQKLNEELLHKQRDITAAVIRAQETERTQLGRELHDNVNQVLTTVKLYNEMYLTGYVADKELLVKSTAYVQDCINEIRSISKRLSAPTLGDLPVTDSLAELVRSINLTNRVTVAFLSSGLEGVHLCDDAHLALYRIVQEALNNVLKYAGARSATVALDACNGGLCLTISDDGKGFDTAARRNGIGLTNIKTRAESLGGTFTLWSAPGKGCRVRVELPLEPGVVSRVS